ncbi:MAG TPA: hypothetical protein VF980_04065 [Thermoanaerobaculia bacterium]
MNHHGIRVLTCTLLLLAGVVSSALAAAPPAPTPLSPADGAGVVVPFTVSWSAVTDPTGIVAYNWQVSASSSFTPVILQNSTSGPTQDTVSGLANGTYFWRAQAVNGSFEQGAWSATRRLVVTGAGPNSPGSPTLGPTKAYSTFHPMETITFNWSSVPGAATYVLQTATDPSFPVVSTFKFDNIPNTTYSFQFADSEQGNYSARVYAVDANGIAGVPSNVITYSVFFTNPIGAAPVIASPANGSTLTLPVTLTWHDVPNPQPSGYELQIAKDSGFGTIEEDDPQLTDPSRQILSLTAGTKFWRVRSAQGDASQFTAAETAWSSTGTFTIPNTPPKPVSISLIRNPIFSGLSTFIQVQLTSAVGSSGATITLSSSSSAALPVPATIAMPPNTAWAQVDMGQSALKAGQVTSATPVTLTATLNSASASGQVTVLSPSLASFTISTTTISGGARSSGFIQLNGTAPDAGALVTLSSNSAAATPPPTVSVPAGQPGASFLIDTSSVTANTTATITASWNGVSSQAQLTVTPQQPPATLTLSPTSTVGQSGGSFATVTVASANPSDETLQVSSSNPAVASVPNSVTIPAGSTAGGFNIFTQAVTTQTLVTISVTGGGVTRSATLTVNPQASGPGVASLTLSPTSVNGGTNSKGTVTLTSAAPAGGVSVALSSSNAAASVPASVTVPAGATSATFTIATTSVGTATTSTVSAAAGGTSAPATLTVNPAPPSATLTVTATGRSGERITSSPAGISVAVGSTGSASFATGTSITLTVSNGRDAIWSGACSSNGNKAKSCTFTLNGAASVTGNVQ